ncbi:hypothetical protein [Pseudomonas sp. IT-P395]|uniref:hypothetical protein n=1 Tax=Pseudomonas sp. IT-P395 TaxID=3026459 RepID=UPI0039DF7708
MKTYNGFVFNSAGEEHAATLKFDDPAQQTGKISNGYMDYYGLDFGVNGDCTKSTGLIFLQRNQMPRKEMRPSMAQALSVLR